MTCINDLLNVASWLLIVKIMDVIVVSVAEVQRVIVADDVLSINRLVLLVRHVSILQAESNHV